MARGSAFLDLARGVLQSSYLDASGFQSTDW